MKKFGFTLIELLATVAIIALIALIAVPIISDVVEGTKLEAFKDNSLSIFKSVDLYTVEFGVNEISDEGIDITTLDLSGDKFTGGKVFEDENGYYVENLTDGEYCASGSKGDLSIYKGECDTTAPTVTLAVLEGVPNAMGWYNTLPRIGLTTSVAAASGINFGIGYNPDFSLHADPGDTGYADMIVDISKSVNGINEIFGYAESGVKLRATESLILKVDTTVPDLTINTSTYSTQVHITASASDSESGVSGYRYSIDGGNTFEPEVPTENNEYTFTGLGIDTHNVIVRAYNNADLYAGETASVVTEGLIAPTFSDPGSDWNTSKDITVTFTGDGEYFVTTEFDTVSNIEGLECSIVDAVSTCTTNSTTTFESGKWYKVESNPTLTFDKEGYIVGKVIDNIDQSVALSYNIVNIDTEDPIINIDPATVEITTEDVYDTLTGVTCTDNISCTISQTGVLTLGVEGVYTITYTATDLAGNSASGTREITIVSASTPWVAYNNASGILNSPATAVSQYMTGCWGYGKDSFGSTGGHTNSTGGSMGIDTKNVDGSVWLPTKGCKYVDFSIICGSSSGWWISSSGALIGKKADGSTVTIATGAPTHQNNTAWTMTNVDVSEYEYIRLYGRASYNTTVNAWLNQQMNNLEFHN